MYNIVYKDLKLGGVTMATKSFQTDFKFSAKAGEKLARAIESSRKVDLKSTKGSKNIKNKETINNIMSSFLMK